MDLLETLGPQFFEISFCICLVLMLYACLQQAILWSLLILLIIYYCFRVIQERGAEHVSPDGKYVLITGCDTGIGHELAKRLRTMGFNVIATCLDEYSKGAKELEEMTYRMHVLPLDVTSDDSVRTCVTNVNMIIQDKGLYALINNAGIIGMGDVEFQTMRLYQSLADVNIFGTIRVTKAFLPLVRKSKGRVINVTSVRGLVSFPANSSYVMTKYAAEAFSDCLRMEMKRFGVKVIIVEPGNFAGASGLWNEDNVQRMMKTKDEMKSAATDEVLEAYGPKYLDGMFDAAVASKGTSYSNLDPVMAALTEAVTNVKPQYRYLIDGSNQVIDIDCVMARLRPFLPVNVLDTLMMRVRGPPPVAAQD